MQIVLYEDGQFGQFGPLTLLRPEFELRCGALTLREKLEARRPEWRVALLPRAELRDVVEERYPDRGVDALGEGRTLFLSGRVIVDDELVSAFEGIEGETLLTSGGEIVGALVDGHARGRVDTLAESPGDLSRMGVGDMLEIPARVVSYPWELVRLTAEEIVRDAPVVSRGLDHGGEICEGAHLLNEGSISLGEGSSIAPGAVLDARNGPILVGRGVTVMANAYIEGPVALGDRCTVKAGARIYSGTSVGPVCKVGGEIEGSVFQGWSNKQHEGFLGHSYVASWVNLGAATDNSDLKNNYGSVRVTIDGRTVDTESTFVGATIGDHTKTAIGTKLNTGTVVGIFCNVVSTGFPPKYVPSFSWGAPGGFVEHDLERALSAARIAMGRRDVEMSRAEEDLIRSVHAATASERGA